MDKFDGIKRAQTKLKRNTYVANKRAPKNIIWRYIVAALLVFFAAMSSIKTDFVAQLFKQDYIVQYAQD